MKIVLFGIFCLITSLTAKAQGWWAWAYSINFDNKDTFYFLENTSPGIDTLNRLQFDNWIYIDTVNYKRNQWQIGKPIKKIFDSAYSLPRALMTDTEKACLPNDTSIFVLKFPDDVGVGIEEFTLNYRLQMDSSDMAKVEYSFDSGLSWICIDSCSLSAPGKSLSANTSEWHHCNLVGLTYPPINDTFLVRFTYISGSDTTQRDGWIIDDILMGYFYESGVAAVNPPIFYLYPNPANDDVHLKLKQGVLADCQMTVIDGLGRRVFEHRLNKGSTEYSLNVRGWTKGLYFIELDGKGNKSVRKLMVE